MNLLQKSWSAIRLVTPNPRVLTVAAQIAIFCLSGIAAYLIRFEFRLPPSVFAGMLWAIPTWVVVKSIVFVSLRLHRGWWSFVSVPDVVRIGVGNLLGSAVSAALLILVHPALVPKSVYLLDLILCAHATAGVRLLTRIARDYAQQNRFAHARPVLIYGAGAAGIALLREIQASPQLDYDVFGFIDDNSSKKGMLIHRLPVLGPGSDLERIAKRYAIRELLVAIPSATGAQMSEILRRGWQAGLHCKTIPGLAEIIAEGRLSRQIRDVAVEDLLGRNPVRLEHDLIAESIAGKTVLVTGAAGSIGSELCRQIARFQPAGIVGFEIAESPLFEIDREMCQAFPQVPFYPEIGSIQNRARLDEVLRQYRPSVVYHAAAYKHVPMMEAHVFEAIENNVFGTYNVAVAAAENGVEDFVMISSDKAVRPTNIMGATKRIAELLLLTLQNGGTKFVAVRFGNVLGSNGSVIPIFKKQIAAGGPVTVTHPEMRRFFMTIPEACQLVLQAAAIGEGGQICVLDMGEPVKIVDLATNLILLSGLRPDEDIKIEFSGIRPGEKLYEELSTTLEDTAPTTHEKIRIYVGNAMPENDMLELLDRLRQICESRDAARLVIALKEIVLDYNPSANLLKRVMKFQENPAVA
jgi:FlaA1/EpsC-like NDP-sugar epimerase